MKKYRELRKDRARILTVADLPKRAAEALPFLAGSVEPQAVHTAPVLVDEQRPRFLQTGFEESG